MLVLLIWLFAWLPRPAARGLGSGIGKLFYKINDKRRNIAEINVDWCFPELSADERGQLVRDHFRRYGQSIVDLGLIWFASRRRLLRQVRIEGFEIVAELLNRHENVILLAPHCSSMDMGGVAWSEKVPSTSMMKALDNPVLNWLITRGRGRFGGGMIERAQGIRPLVRMLRAGVPSYYLPDEDFGAQMSVFAPFFGIPTATLPALSRIAKVAPCPRRALFHVH